jgi:hypothetical protein
MSSQLAAYRSDFQALKEDATRLVADVDDSTLLTSPTEGAWSVVQIFDNLNTTGRPLLNALEAAIQDAQETGPYGEPPFEYGVVSRWFIHAMQPSSGWVLPAPPSLQPEPSATLSPSAPPSGLPRSAGPIHRLCDQCRGAGPPSPPGTLARPPAFPR